MYPVNVKPIKFPEWMEPNLRVYACKLEIDRCRAEIRALRLQLQEYTKQRAEEKRSVQGQRKLDRAAVGFGKKAAVKSRVSPKKLSPVS
jgi:hypothetical protein